MRASGFAAPSGEDARHRRPDWPPLPLPASKRLRSGVPSNFHCRPENGPSCPNVRFSVDCFRFTPESGPGAEGPFSSAFESVLSNSIVNVGADAIDVVGRRLIKQVDPVGIEDVAVGPPGVDRYLPGDVFRIVVPRQVDGITIGQIAPVFVVEGR